MTDAAESAARLAEKKLESAAEVADLQMFDPASLQDMPIPVRKWIVPDIVPCGVVTLVSGDGGVGKSLIMMQLMTAVALGKPWIGEPTTPCKTLGVFCEDDIDELHRRQASINAHYDTEFGDLTDMQWLERVGENSLMMTFDGHSGESTAFFQQVRTAALDFGAQLVVLDSLHDLFSGNENDRSAARQFVSLLRSIATAIDGAVILTAHPSLSGMSSGSGMSGSTAWHNAVRSRLYLTRPQVEEGQEVDDFERILSIKKANYGAGGDSISLRWNKGVFEAQEPETGILGNIERRTAEKAFLDALDALKAQGRIAGHSRSSPSYAPKLMVSMPETNGFKKHQIEAAMNRLFSDSQIAIKEDGPASRRRSFIVLAGAGSE